MTKASSGKCENQGTNEGQKKNQALKKVRSAPKIRKEGRVFGMHNRAINSVQWHKMIEV